MLHIEFIVEEISTEEFLKIILPKVLGRKVSFSIHAHNGKDELLRKLPNRLKGYKKWIPSNFRIVVLVDQDNQDCRRLKRDLDKIANEAGFATKSSTSRGKFQVLNRIAIEELESWFFGDIPALTLAYPRVPDNLNRKAAFRNPDAISGGTWERLEKILQNAGYYSAGLQKVSAAVDISTHMVPERNQSNSFQVFISGLKAMVETGPKRDE